MAWKALFQRGFYPLAILLAFSTWGRAEATLFSRADVNQDGAVDISDPVWILQYLFLGDRPAPDCMDSADADDSGAVDISDGIAILSFLFTGGNPPVDPYPGCGEDPTEDGLSCGSFSNGRCPPLGPPEGELVAVELCKSHDTELAAEAGLNQECMEYEFNSGNTLKLKHVNAAFNCCSEPQGSVAVEGDLISISESEIIDGVACPCLCLRDLGYEIRNLPPGKYTIHVDGLNSPPLETPVDLTHGASGSYCEDRNFYPWNE